MCEYMCDMTETYQAKQADLTGGAANFFLVTPLDAATSFILERLIYYSCEDPGAAVGGSCVRRPKSRTTDAGACEQAEPLGK